MHVPGNSSSEPSQPAGDPLPVHPPEAVLKIALRLEKAGFETWCVGGAVRDALLGHPHLDWDLATQATPQEVRRLFRRTVPVGLDFGTIGVLDGEGLMHEVTTFRRDVQTDGRHAVVEFGASLDDDLARRDFTINAIAYSPSRRVLRDPYGGREDLGRRLVRAVGDADLRMREDRLRALRAIRFAARFGFAIEPATWEAIVRSAPHLGKLSAERVKQELEKTMEQVERPSAALRMWRESGALATLVPSLAALSATTLASLDCVPKPMGPKASQRRVGRLTALVAELSRGSLLATLRGLRFSNADVAWISNTVERWRTLAPEMDAALASTEGPRDVQVRRWVAVARRTGVGAVMRLAAARHAAARALGVEAAPARAIASLYRRMRRSALRDPVELADLALDGDDLRAAGVPAGPLIGRILNQLLDDVLEEPSRNTREWLLARAMELYRVWSGETG